MQVPSTVFVLDNDALLPRTSTGKIQRLLVLTKLKEAGVEPTLQASLVSALVSNIIENHYE